MTEEEERDRYERMVEDEERRPLTYFKHDALAHDDPKLQDLRDEHGMGAYGRYWLLVGARGAQLPRRHRERPAPLRPRRGARA